MNDALCFRCGANLTRSDHFGGCPLRDRDEVHDLPDEGDTDAPQD